jgi:hypothetical protein
LEKRTSVEIVGILLANMPPSIASLLVAIGGDSMLIRKVISPANLNSSAGHGEEEDVAYCGRI